MRLNVLIYIPKTNPISFLMFIAEKFSPRISLQFYDELGLKFVMKAFYNYC